MGQDGRERQDRREGQNGPEGQDGRKTRDGESRSVFSLQPFLPSCLPVFLPVQPLLPFQPFLPVQCYLPYGVGPAVAWVVAGTSRSSLSQTKSLLL